MSALKHLEAFIAVSQCGSFAAASIKLGVSKAMMSRRVADLEASLQVRLLNRSTRSLALTDSGRAYLERCTDILHQLDEANAAVRADTLQVRGKLRINAPLAFTNQHLAPIWGAFLLQYPQVELDVELSDRFIDTVDEGFDLTIRIGQLNPSSLVARQFASARMALCAAPKYLAQTTPIHTPQDVMSHRVNVYTGSSQGNHWRFAHPLTGEQEVLVQSLPGLRCNSGEACVQAAIAGYGLTYQPLFLIEQALAEQKLSLLLENYDTPRLGIYALYPSRKHLSGKVRAMVDFLVHSFEGKTW